MIPETEEVKRSIYFIEVKYIIKKNGHIELMFTKLWIFFLKENWHIMK